MGLFAPLRHGLFARFFAGQAVSQLGDAVFFVAITWQALQLSSTGSALGIVFAAYMGAQVAFLLAGGVVVDRFPRRAVVVASDVAQAILAAAVAALALTGAIDLVQLVVLAGLFGAAQAVAMPALTTYVADIVPRESLQGATSLYQGSRTVTYIAGPALGAFIIALGGTGVAFAFNALTFVVSAAFLASARIPRAAPPAGAPAEAVATTSSMAAGDVPVEESRRSIVRDVREGVHVVARTPWLWITIIVFAVTNAAEAGPRNAVLPLFATESLDAGVEGIGLLLSAQAVGSLVGFLTVGSLPTISRRGLLGYSMTVVAGVSILGLAFVTTLWQALALSAVRGVAFAVFGIMWETSIMDQVDERVRGRVFSLDMLVSFSLLPLALPLSGVLADVIGARATFLYGGLFVVAAGALGLVYRRASAFTPEERASLPPRAPGAPGGGSH